MVGFGQWTQASSTLHLGWAEPMRACSPEVECRLSGSMTTGLGWPPPPDSAQLAVDLSSSATEAVPVST